MTYNDIHQLQLGVTGFTCRLQRNVTLLCRTSLRGSLVYFVSQFPCVFCIDIHAIYTFTKYEAEIKSLQRSEQNNKEILNTLKQQSQLYSKEMKELQEKTIKLEKEVNEKNMLIQNLKQEKNVLLQMRNSDSSAQIPEVEALKRKLSETEKKLMLEKTKVEQK